MLLLIFVDFFFSFQEFKDIIQRQERNIMELEEKIDQYNALAMMMRSTSGSSEGEENGEEDAHGGNVFAPTTTATSAGRMSSLVAGMKFLAPTLLYFARSFKSFEHAFLTLLWRTHEIYCFVVVVV